MSSVTVRGVPFEFDPLDADQMLRYEQALDELSPRDKLPAGGRMSERIRAECEAVFRFFDMALGEGAAAKIFAGRVHLGMCLDAAEEFVGGVIALQQSYEDRLAAYNPARLEQHESAR